MQNQSIHKSDLKIIDLKNMIIRTRKIATVISTLILLYANASFASDELLIEAQKILNSQGYNAGAEDGLWGQGTSSAISEYQANADIPKTGMLDSATLDSLGIGRSSQRFSLGSTCSYFGEELPQSVHAFKSDKEAEDVIEQIVAASGLPKNFQVKAAGVPNAAAMLLNGQRYIMYSQYFIQEMQRITDSPWASYSVMAHEIGHHLAGHTLQIGGSRPHLELEADQYSGFVLQRLGASLKEAQLLMDKVADKDESETHPAKHDRLAAIASGWKNSCDFDKNCGKTSRKEGKTNSNSLEDLFSTTSPASLFEAEKQRIRDEGDLIFADYDGGFCNHIYSKINFPEICRQADRAGKRKIDDGMQLYGKTYCGNPSGETCVSFKERNYKKGEKSSLSYSSNYDQERPLYSVIWDRYNKFSQMPVAE